MGERSDPSQLSRSGVSRRVVSCRVVLCCVVLCCVVVEGEVSRCRLTSFPDVESVLAKPSDARLTPRRLGSGDEEARGATRRIETMLGETTATRQAPGLVMFHAYTQRIRPV
jgi:hypothetical protein